MERDIQHACYLSASWLGPCASCLPPWYVRLLLRITLCCSVLQCVAVSCSVLRWSKFRPVGSGCVRPAYSPGMAVCCSVLPCVAVCCRVLRVLQSRAGGCSEASSALLARAVCVLPTPLVRPCVAAYSLVLQCVVLSCSFVQ